MAPPGVLEISRADSYAGPAVAGTPGRLGRLGVGLQHRTLFPLAHIVGKPGSVHQCLEGWEPHHAKSDDLLEDLAGLSPVCNFR